MSDYTIDWSNTNIDGTNSVSGTSGSVGFTVATPENVDHDQWMKGTVGGYDGLKAWDVNDPTSVKVTFDQDVENISFEIFDVDSDNHTWDDRVTVIARDADGNIVPVQFSNLAHHHYVNGNQLDTTGNVNSGVEGSGAADSVTVHIAGPIASLEVIYDNGAGAATSGTIGLSDIHFDAVANLDGYVDGTAGSDVIDVAYTGDPDGDRVDNSDALLPGEAAEDDIILAGAGDDTVSGGNGNNEIYGGSGNDMISSGFNDDVVYGGTGNDKIEASAGNDVVIGGEGEDDIWSGRGSDTVSGGRGHDDINGGSEDDLLAGGKGDDFIEAGTGNDTVFGGANNDSILGGEGDDTLIGGNASFDGVQGFDDLSAGELIDGQFVADGLTITSGDPKTPVMVFDTANPTGGDTDLATSNLGKVLILSEDRDSSDPDDNARGGVFNLEFDGPASVTSLTLLDVDGGAWVKYYDMNGNLLGQVDARTADNGQIVIDNDFDGVFRMEVILGNSGAIDNIEYSIDRDEQDGADVIFGGAGDDYIEGNAGADRLSGGDGNDDIFGGTGNDVIGGGAGNDYIEGNEGDDMVEAAHGNDTIFGGAGNDDLWASHDDDYVEGGTGEDKVYGGSGNDTLFGGADNDEIYGGSDTDTVYGDDGDDVIYGDKVFKDDTGTGAADTLFGGAGQDTIYGEVGNDSINGGADDDEIYGGDGNDRIFGNDGDDVAFGGDGNDTLGGADFGNDEYYGGAGDDMFETSFGDDTLFGGSGNDNLWASSDNDIVFGGTGDDSAFGGSGNDTVYGDEGNDTVSGGSGSDTVFGGSGDDLINGGGNFKDDTGADGPDQLFGGDDADTIIAGAGDVVDGGAGGNDHDTLDLTGEGPFFLAGPDGTGAPVPDSNGNGIDGTVIFVDENGVPTGETLSFTEIERVIGDEVNRGPDAQNDTAEVDEDGSVDIPVLDNDNDPDGDPLTVTAATSPNGTVTINTDGTLTFEPDENFNGDTTITYTISDGNGGEDTATVTVTVNPVNDGPVAQNDTAEVDEDGSVDIPVLDNDNDPDGDPLTVTAATSPNGTVTINTDGTLTFEPDENFNGDTTITYTISDGNGGEDTATVDVTVNGVNDDPIACPDLYIVTEDEGTGDVDGNVITNPSDNNAGLDIDPDGDTLTVVAINGDAGGVGTPIAGDNGGLFTLNPDGSFDFTANEEFEYLSPGESAETQIEYTVSDGNGGFGTATLTIRVQGINDAPEARDSSYTVAQDEAFGDDDANAITDDTGEGADSDPEDDPLTVVAVDGDPANVGGTVAGDNGGLFTINADGSVDFSANGEFDDLGTGESASTTVTYTIADPEGLEDTATVTFTVTGTNDGPVAEEDTFDAGEDDAPAVIGNVLDNDEDPDNDPLSVAEVNGDPDNVGQPVAGDNGGLITINPDGSVTFDPNGDFEDLGTGEEATTTVTYTVTDPSGAEDTETVTITVTGVNDGPDATDNAYTVTLTEAEGDVDGNVITDNTGDDVDSDPEGDPLEVVAVDGDPANVGTPVAGDNGGLFTINPDGTVDFDANGDFDDLGLGETDTTSVTYTITDPEGGQDTATVTFTVTGINDGTVQGTEGNDIINPDIPYVDADGDIVDANDGILPGDEGTNNDVIFGFGGDDTIQAGAGNDDVFGGEGDDSITGNAGDDSLSGDAGNDIIRGGIGDDTIDGGDDMDMLFGGAGDDSLDGGAGDDKIEGGSGDDTLIGGEGNDDLWGASGDDSVDGGAGDDTIATAEGNDVVEGGDGDDIIDTGNDENPLGPDFGQNLPDVGYPGVYPADLDPNDDLDTVFGGAGNDSISTGDDNDTIFGGSGNDTIDAGVDDDTVEGGTGDDIIIGSEGNDEIAGEDGNDTIYGGLVPGTIGGFGNLPDDLDGDGDSNDPGEDLVTNNNNDTLFGGAGNDTIFGEDDDDTLFGGTGDDVLDGGVDDDTLYGDEGADTLTGGQGADSQFGGLGNDVFIVDTPGEGAGDVIVGGEDPDLDGDGQSDDVDVLDLTGSNVDFITYEDDDPEAGVVTFLDGTTLTFSEIENVIPCFTPGTTIATPKGERLVEELREGDRIITRDNGIQEIRWVGRKEMSGKSLVANPHLKPILIKAGALGNGLPERDMMVSPNHRCLVASEKTQLYFEEREVLAAAKHLVGSEGIHEVDVMGTAYIHFMFDRHEVVLSNGAWTESFQPGDYSLKGIGNSQRNEIFELFPELATKTGLGNYQSARRALKKHEARLLVK